MSPHVRRLAFAECAVVLDDTNVEISGPRSAVLSHACLDLRRVRHRTSMRRCCVRLSAGTGRAPWLGVIQRDDLLALLALRLSCASSAELVARLRETPAPRMLANEAGWRPGPRDWHEARRQLVATMAVGLDVVPVWDLPESLAGAAWSPSLLFVRGAASLLHREAIAVVGARRASAGAVEWAAARAREASERGYVVVSGGARGVDAAAHRGALRAGGPTVAYLGVAADRIYPASNRDLFARVVGAGGALVSEHPPGVETFKSGHATRNRFIAAHARAVLVAEAGIRSGTLSTAAFARRAGVPVWVSPDNVGRERAGLDRLLAAGTAGIWLGWGRAGLDRDRQRIPGASSGYPSS